MTYSVTSIYTYSFILVTQIKQLIDRRISLVRITFAETRVTRQNHENYFVEIYASKFTESKSDFLCKRIIERYVTLSFNVPWNDSERERRCERCAPRNVTVFAQPRRLLSRSHGILLCVECRTLPQPRSVIARHAKGNVATAYSDWRNLRRGNPTPRAGDKFSNNKDRA